MSYSGTFRKLGLTLQDAASSAGISILCIRERNDAMADRIAVDQQECTDGVALSQRGAYLRHPDRDMIFLYQQQTGIKVDWFMTHPWAT